MKRKDLEEHVTMICQWRIVECDHCNEPRPECKMQVTLNQHIWQKEKKVHSAIFELANKTIYWKVFFFMTRIIKGRQRDGKVYNYGGKLRLITITQASVIPDITSNQFHQLFWYTLQKIWTLLAVSCKWNQISLNSEWRLYSLVKYLSFPHFSIMFVFRLAINTSSATFVDSFVFF